RRAGGALSARVGAVSAAEDDLEYEPAASGLLLRRPAAGAGGTAAPASEWLPPRHPFRPGWLGENKARSRGRRRARLRVQGGGLLGRPRAAARPRARAGHRRADARREGRPDRPCWRARAHAAARQLRTGHRGRTRALAAARVVPEPEAPGYEPRAPPHRGRVRLPGPAPGEDGGSRPLLRALAARGRRDDRRALLPTRRHAAGRRARRLPHPRPHANADPRPALAASRPAQGRPGRRPPPANPAG